MTRAPPATPYVVMTSSMIVDPHPPHPSQLISLEAGVGWVGADNQDRRHTSHEDLYGSGTASPMLPQAIAPSAQLAGPPPATHFRCDARPAVPSATTPCNQSRMAYVLGDANGLTAPAPVGPSLRVARHVRPQFGTTTSFQIGSQGVVSGSSA